MKFKSYAKNYTISLVLNVKDIVTANGTVVSVPQKLRINFFNGLLDTETEFPDPQKRKIIEEKLKAHPDFRPFGPQNGGFWEDVPPKEMIEKDVMEDKLLEKDKEIERLKKMLAEKTRNKNKKIKEDIEENKNKPVF